MQVLFLLDTKSGMNSSTTILAERLSRVLQNDSHRAGLKPTQWEVLRYLSRANRFSRSPGAITAYLGMTKGTVSQTLQALERRGLIQKQTSATDRRGVMIDLSEAGAALLSQDPMQAFESALADLSPSERETLEAALHAVVRTMLTRRNGRPFGVCGTCIHFRRKHENGAPHFCALLEEPLSDDDSARICAEQETAA